MKIPLISNSECAAGSLLALGALFGSLSAVYLMDAVGRKASLLAFSVMSLFIGELNLFTEPKIQRHDKHLLLSQPIRCCEFSNIFILYF
jgi:hypothetical protein